MSAGIARIAISLPGELTDWLEAERVRLGVARSQIVADALQVAKQTADEAARAARRLDAIDRLHGVLAAELPDVDEEEERP